MCQIATIGSRVRDLRDSQGLTQEALAAKLGVARATLASWETGRRSPDAETLKKLASVLQTTTDYLLGASRIQKVDQSQESIWVRETPPTDIELEELLRASNPNFFGAPLNDEDIEDILTYMRVKWERNKKKREKGGKN
ncbi:MAG: helix-turn-helix domain-containing protein [Clostridiales bacterium]|mgnify:CR=1 FL=1|nr:helix-turn-helix domain-containing protein [Clostridiales bacterium]